MSRWTPTMTRVVKRPPPAPFIQARLALCPHANMRSCKDIHMPTIAIISQKGGAGKTTLALHLAAAAEDSGHTALVIDVDPQATASQWAAWRQDAPPVVIDSAPPDRKSTRLNSSH